MRGKKGEVLVICIRHINKELEIQEDIFGFCELQLTLRKCFQQGINTEMIKDFIN